MAISDEFTFFPADGAAFPYPQLQTREYKSLIHRVARTELTRQQAIFNLIGYADNIMLGRRLPGLYGGDRDDYFSDDFHTGCMVIKLGPHMMCRVGFTTQLGPYFEFATIREGCDDPHYTWGRLDGGVVYSFSHKIYEHTVTVVKEIAEEMSALRQL